MTSDETVAVVVVTYHSEPLLADLIGSFEAGLAGVRWHLTVADNHSADGTVPTLRRLAPAATVVEMGGNRGYAAGINAAVAAAAPHTAVLVLNPDVRLAPGCVRTLLATLRQPGTGIAVPRLERGDGQPIPVLRREPSVLRALGDAVLGARRAGRVPLLGELVAGAGHYTRETVADWAAGSAMLISSACWDRCAPWDESFFLYSEETDFALRARDAGLPTRLAPQARVVHLEGDSKVSPPLYSLLTVNRVRLYRRRHRPPATVAYWSALVLRELTRAAIGRRPSRAALAALLSPARRRALPAGSGDPRPSPPAPDGAHGPGGGAPAPLGQLQHAQGRARQEP